MRSVQVTMAASMLAVPASAFALSGPSPAAGQPVSGEPDPSSLGLAPAPRPIPFGDAVSITGTAPAADAGRSVVLCSPRRWPPAGGG